MIKSYRDLEVYQRAYNLALRVHRITLDFPKYETTELGGQLRRAALSIPINIGEGYGRKSSVADFKRFLIMALGSCDEVRIELDFAKDLGYIDEEKHEELTNEYIILGKQIRVLHEKWE
jgi:four helix bundle protein